MPKTSRHIIEVGLPDLQNLVNVNLVVEEKNEGLNVFIKRFEHQPFGNTELAVSAVAIGREAAKHGRTPLLFDINHGLVEASNTFESRPLNKGLVRVIGVSVDKGNRVSYLTIEGSEEMIKGRLG